MIDSRTLDGRTQLVEYRPRVLEHPPLAGFAVHHVVRDGHGCCSLQREAIQVVNGCRVFDVVPRAVGTTRRLTKPVGDAGLYSNG